MPDSGAKSTFMHVGMTVADLDVTIAFYKKYFGFSEGARSTFSSEFIAALPQLYNQEEGVYSDYAFINHPDGIMLELFCFSKMIPAENAVWNRPGIHHLCFKVENLQATYEEMVADGVSFFFAPRAKKAPNEHEHWVFLKDPDGNLIELQD